MKKIDRTNKLWQLNIFGNSESELLKDLKNHLEGKNGLLTIGTPNPEQIVLRNSSTAFSEALSQFEVLLPDGIGLVIAKRLWDAKHGLPGIKERIAGVSVVQKLCAFASSAGIRVLVIGGRDYSSLDKFCQSAVWTEGYKAVANPTENEEAKLADTIAHLRPAIVFVAFGAPQQELWIQSHRALLEQSGVKIAMVVGGSFDILLGKISRAPGWVQAMGLEWLYRLIQQPWRWKRQLKLLEFIGLTTREIL